MWPMLVMLIWLADPVIPQTRALNNYQINPKPCWVKGLQGKCMFVWECINSGGRHVGMCVEAFMFGTCCAHNLTDSDLSRVPSSSERRPQLAGQQSRPSDHPTTRPPFITRPIYHQQTYKPSSQHYDKWNKPPANELDTVASDGPPGVQERPLKGNQAGGWAGFVTKQRPAGRPTSQQTTKLRPLPRPPQPQPKPQPTTSSTTSSTSTTSTTTSSTSTTSTTTTTTPTPPHRAAATDRPATTTSNGLSATSGPIQCGIPPLHPPRPETRIVGGRNAQFGVWPWQGFGDIVGVKLKLKMAFKRRNMFYENKKQETVKVVSVRRTSFFGFSSTHRCGGALINERWIATAGHCVDDLLTSQIRIRVGEFDFSSVQEPYPYAERGVGRKVVHPKYNFFTYEYDLALVKLDNPLEFAPHIAPICLPGSNDLLIGENATVTGWGRLSDGGTLPSVLQQVTVPIISNDRCKNMFLRAGRHEFFPDIFICAGFDDGGRDACQGDSGGPLQVRGKDGRYFLAGIISWGIGCAEANLPGVCTRISKFVPWILETVT